VPNASSAEHTAAAAVTRRVHGPKEDIRPPPEHGR
jgi:hypothetical protein